jgi:acyl carrier protein
MRGDMEEIKADIRSFIAGSILFSAKGYPYKDDVSFLENGVVDSMNIMEIVMFAENKFGIKVEDEDIVPENFDSIERLAMFVENKKNGFVKETK